MTQSVFTACHRGHRILESLLWEHVLSFNIAASCSPVALLHVHVVGSSVNEWTDKAVTEALAYMVAEGNLYERPGQ